MVHVGVRSRKFSLRVLALLALLFVTATIHAEAQTKAYVTQGDASAVTVIDTATGAAKVEKCKRWKSKFKVAA